jgi:hypothetical protein
MRKLGQRRQTVWLRAKSADPVQRWLYTLRRTLDLGRILLERHHAAVRGYELHPQRIDLFLIFCLATTLLVPGTVHLHLPPLHYRKKSEEKPQEAQGVSNRG